MTIYNYTRDLVNGAYDINNIARVDAEGKQISLSSEISAVPAFAHKFNIICNGTGCDIDFNFTLSAPEKTQLDTIVSNHKNNL